MTKLTKSHRISRRSLLQGFGAGASASALSCFTPTPAAHAQGLLTARRGGTGGKIAELIVLTGVTPWLPAYQKVAAEYEKQRGIKITLRPFPYGGMRTQMVNAIQSGSVPFDVFQVDEGWTGQFYDNDWVRPLDDVVPGLKLDPNILTYDGLPFWDKALRTSSPQGRIMGLPLNGNVDLLVYRKDLYDKLGLTPPKTWEEAIANGQKALKAGIAKFGYVTRGQPTTGGASVTYEYMPVFYSYGGNWFADEGKDWTPTVNTAAAQAGTETFRRLLELGPPKPQTVGQADVIALMQGGQGFQGHFVAAAAAQLEDPERSAMVGKFGYAVVPAGSTGRSAPTSGTWSMCVPAARPQENQKAAADYIMWMLDRQQQENFVRAGGIPTRKDVTDAFDAKTKPPLDALMASMPSVRRSPRYVFAAPMLDATEQNLSQIGSGDVPVKDGLDRLQGQLTEIVKKAGFLHT